MRALHRYEDRAPFLRHKHCPRMQWNGVHKRVHDRTRTSAAPCTQSSQRRKCIDRSVTRMTQRMHTVSQDCMRHLFARACARAGGRAGAHPDGERSVVSCSGVAIDKIAPTRAIGRPRETDKLSCARGELRGHCLVLDLQRGARGRGVHRESDEGAHCQLSTTQSHGSVMRHTIARSSVRVINISRLQHAAVSRSN
jgi:hypothetical protein